jgi:ATP-dependent Lhr-like helicase
MFWHDLIDETGLTPDQALPALWDLVWAGEVTNDAWTPLRAGRRYGVPKPQRRPRRFSRSRSTAITATQGRWSRTERLFAGSPDRRALAELLLERHGVITRDAVRAEGIAGGYGAVYQELRALETLGLCRRGYFVEGLGGAQFALPGAVERLRAQKAEDEAPPIVLAATDPAQPYGAALPWPKREGASKHPQRAAGAHVVLAGSEPVLYVERGGRGILVLAEPDDARVRPSLEALAAFITSDRRRKLSLERIDGEPVVGSAWEPLLIELGFRQGPRKLTLSA